MEQKIRVLVLGGTGMLGHVLINSLEKNKIFDVQNIVYRKKINKKSITCDVTKKNLIQKKIIKTNPKIIINCVGVLIRGSKENPANAIYVNSFFPHFISKIADKINAKLIHISTDCVFSGKKGGYSENDKKDANDLYGMSKSLGEIDSKNHLTLRTSIIGPELKNNGEGLLHWFLNQKGNISGYTNAIWGGVTTLELSKVIVYLISQNTSGLVNITNGISISKYEILKLLQKTFNHNITINKKNSKRTDKSLSSLRKDVQYQVQSYDKMFKDLYNYMIKNKKLYSHYNL